MNEDIVVPFKCLTCDRPVDIEGDTTIDCPVSRSDDQQCDRCGGCYCDGAC